MDDSPTLPPGENRFQQLIEALRRKDPKLNASAAEVFCVAGKVVVPLLVREALGPGKHPNHRIRILDVIQRIGGPLGVDFLDFIRLLRHPVQRVCEKAAEVVAALRPGGQSGSGSTKDLAALFLASGVPPWTTRRRPRRRSSLGFASERGQQRRRERGYA